MQLSCSRTSLADVWEVSNKLREADLAEIKAGNETDPFKAILRGFLEGESYTLFADGEHVGIFGYSDVQHGVGSIWFLGTDRSAQEDMKSTWLIVASHLINYGIQKYGTLLNTVWNGNKAHIAWLRFLGAEIYSDDTDFSTFIFRS